MKRITYIIMLLGFCGQYSLGQNPILPTQAKERINTMQKRHSMEYGTSLNGIPFRSVGPTVFSGRVVDIAVSPDDPSHFYVAYASGGLWKTTNNGISFESLFDHELVMTIGAIAVDWENQTIWVGTGEVNSSRSSYAGIGMYKSTDDGKTWQHMGLPETHHIGKVMIHPDAPNTVWVAALGHLYSPNEERGIFKTTDGGQTWTKTLFVNENTGAVDLVVDPLNANVLYAATWHRERRAWNFVESGSGTGIYKSTDAGQSWMLITKKNNGFPIGEGAGRIGLALYHQGDQSVLYASIDNYFRKPKEDPEPGKLTKDMLRTMSKEEFLALPKYQIEDYLKSYRFPRKYKVKSVLKMVEKEDIVPEDLVKYVEDANALLFDTPVKGLEVYASTDGGQSWSKRNEKSLDGVYFSYGYYFGTIRVAPQNPDKVYCLGVPVIKSEDGGKTFTNINGDNVHSDHHALWVNPERPGHLILGNDGGINISYDDGAHWNKCNTPAVGQFYYIAVDHQTPYHIYGGLQDNGTWGGPSSYKAATSWQASGKYPYDRVGGGDGMQVAVDTRNNKIIYVGSQFGNYFRLDRSSQKRTYITPKPNLGEAPYRWNWQAPIHLSIHNQDIFYMGSNFLHRSMNQGDDFKIISPDLTKGGLKGDVAFGTLTTIHESPLKFGLLYTGSDDGLVHLSKDGGHSWKNISKGLPEDLWVARVIASAHNENTVYVALNGYRWDDFTSYVYRSKDLGENWERLGSTLPLEPVNVIKEDPKNANLLYVGTDHGLYVSLDGGESFSLLDNGLPAAPVHDVVIHPKTSDIVVGTHGRSIFVGPGKALQKLDANRLTSTVEVFEINSIKYRENWGNARFEWIEPNIPEIKIPVYTKKGGNLTMTIKKEELDLTTFDVSVDPGLNYLTYDLTLESTNMDAYRSALNKDLKKDDKPIEIKKADNEQVYLRPGAYTLELKKEEVVVKTTFKVE